MIIPNYLHKIAVNAMARGNCVYFDLKCICGCDKFLLLKNKTTQEEVDKQVKFGELLKKYNGSCYSDNDGNIVLTTIGFLGLFKRKYKLPKSEIPRCIEIIKAKCSSCNEEYVIFDNKKYGYDGVVEPEIYDCARYDYELIESTPKPSHISFKVTYNLNFSEFLENAGDDFTCEQYSNAFSDLNIYKVSDGKKTRIYYYETA